MDVVAVRLRPLVGDAQRLASRPDRRAVDRVRSPDNQAKDRVADLVVGDPLALVVAHQQFAGRAEDQLLERVQEVDQVDGLGLTPGRLEGRLVDQVPQVGPD